MESRNEKILRSMIDGTEYTAPPQSRIEELLLKLKEQGVGGGYGEKKVGEITITEGDFTESSLDMYGDVFPVMVYDRVVDYEYSEGGLYTSVKINGVEVTDRQVMPGEMLGMPGAVIIMYNDDTTQTLIVYGGTLKTDNGNYTLEHFIPKNHNLNIMIVGLEGDLPNDVEIGLYGVSITKIPSRFTDDVLYGSIDTVRPSEVAQKLAEGGRVMLLATNSSVGFPFLFTEFQQWGSMSGDVHDNFIYSETHLPDINIRGQMYKGVLTGWESYGLDDGTPRSRWHLYIKEPEELTEVD